MAPKAAVAGAGPENNDAREPSVVAEAGVVFGVKAKAEEAAGGGAMVEAEPNAGV